MADDAAPRKDEPTRWKALMSNPRRLIVAVLLIAIAMGVAIYATAAFTTSSANAGNIVAAGTLSVDSGNSAILVAENLVPGQTEEGTVKVSNTGSASGNFSLTTANLVDTPATPAFSAALDLVITDETNPEDIKQVYSGKLNAVGTKQLGNWAAGSTHDYRFVVTFTSQGSTIDNTYQGAKTQLDFVWNAVST